MQSVAFPIILPTLVPAFLFAIRNDTPKSIVAMQKSINYISRKRLPAKRFSLHDYFRSGIFSRFLHLFSNSILCRYPWIAAPDAIPYATELQPIEIKELTVTALNHHFPNQMLVFMNTS